MDKTKNKSFYNVFFIISTILTILLGIALHFAYDFTNHSFITGLFSPINESTWEHLKLVFTPMIIFYITYILIFSIKDKKTINILGNYVFKGIIISMVLITIIHKLYTIIFKEHSSIFNIILYIISMLISFYYIYLNFKRVNLYDNNKIKNQKGILKIFVLFIFFIIFTIYPPKTNLFKDPITNTYGIFMVQ